MLIMKRILFWTTLLGLVSTMPLFGQVGIGTTQPNPSAELEISSANRGLLIPRLSSEDREAIEDPVDGLTVYDKTAKAYSYYDRSRWLFIDRKSTRLNSSHVKISYAVFCLKKKKKNRPHNQLHNQNMTDKQQQQKKETIKNIQRIDHRRKRVRRTHRLHKTLQ